MNNDIKQNGTDFEVVQANDLVRELYKGMEGETLHDFEDGSSVDFSVEEMDKIRANLMLPTYNPATHILIAKDEVPQGLGEALDRLYPLFYDDEADEDLQDTWSAAALIAAKMGDE